ncbi:MAG TPA: GNAT family N-acetyltransferase [Solirubrobacteraceae bacterium]|nr:GNAT family N-acetyltransferase [Solirubrobacteraceae bacterium]
MTSAAIVRPASIADSFACFGLFRRSLWDLMRRIGYLPIDQPDPDVDVQWPAYDRLFAHLGATCAQWWIAEDPQGRPVGYARSTERDGLAELTELFVAPDTRVAGVGRALLERAFAPGLGTHRSIIATVDAAAVALYLRFGVAHQTTGVGVTGGPRPIAPPAGYETAPATVDEVLEIENVVLSHARRQEAEFMLADRPAVVLRRSGRPVAYAFLPNADGHAGPVAARDPADMPAALATLERAAHEGELQRLDLTVPLGAHTAVEWLLGERGFRIDPFYCLFLANGPWAQLDRYLPFNPCLIL